MVSRAAFTVLIAAVSVQRLLELRLSRRNERVLIKAGAVEHGAGHYSLMVMLHAGLLAGSLAETWLLARPFIDAVGYPMLAILALAGAGRIWVISTLGERWTTKVFVAPGSNRIRTGPYRYFSHPNYAIVVVEGVALPLVHTNWITAIVFTVANAVLLTIRIRVENRALEEAESLP